MKGPRRHRPHSHDCFSDDCVPKLRRSCKYCNNCCVWHCSLQQISFMEGLPGLQTTHNTCTICSEKVMVLALSNVALVRRTYTSPRFPILKIQRFDHSLLVFFRQLPEEDQQRVVETLYSSRALLGACAYNSTGRK